MTLTCATGKNIWFFSFLFLMVTPAISQSPRTVFLENLMEKYDIPGISIGILEDGEVSFLGYHGVRSKDTQEAVGSHTIFGAASLSKPVFAYAVLKLEAMGNIDLDRPIYQYLENKDLEHDKRYRQITARMLLSHSSGLPNWRNGALRLIHDPGTQFQYSGEGYMYLAKVVEQIQQQPINEVMKDLVFEPLEMHHSSFIWEDSFETDFASPHDYTGTSKPNWRPRKPVIASSLHTTASDYVKLMMALLQKKKLKRNTYTAMKTPQIEISKTLGWGLGWGVQKSTKDSYLWQWGDNGNLKGFAMLYPKEKKGMVFFVNSYRGLRILPELVSAVFKDSIPAFRMLERSMRKRADEELMVAILDKGYASAIKEFLVNGSAKIDTSLITEGQLEFVALQLKCRNKESEEKNLLQSIAHTFTKSFKAQKNYAVHCIKHGQIQEGVQYYRKAQKITPENIDVSKTIHLLTAKNLEGNVTFKYSDYLWGASVSVSGSFNEWSYTSIPLLKKNGVWTTTITLPPGEYSYQFIVNGYAMLDPKNDEVVQKNGQFNSLLRVK